MEIWYLISGLALLGILLVDIFYTSFSLRGAGIITGPSTRAMWHILARWAPKAIRSQAGMLIMLQTLLQWIVLLWLSHFLIFMSDAGSLVQAQTKAPASVAEKFYVVGYTITTMGNGDFSASSSNWKLFLSATALNGMVVFTVALTYLLQVLSKAKAKRIFCRSISSFGNSADSFASVVGNGETLAPLHPVLNDWSQQIAQLAEIHLSYPIIHYYYSRQATLSLAVMLGVLHEGLHKLYTHGAFTPGDKVQVHGLLQSVGSFLHTVNISFLNKKEVMTEHLPDPFAAASWAARKQLLKLMLADEGRGWSDVPA